MILSTGAVGAVVTHALVATNGACPIQRPTAEAMELQRAEAIGALRGNQKGPPAARTIGPYILGRTTSQDVMAHELRSTVRCTPEIDGALLRCIGPTTETVARFSPTGELVGLDRLEYALSAERAASSIARLQAERVPWGRPAEAWGEPTGTFLSAPLRQTGFVHRFADVATDVSVTNLGASGLVLREQWREIPLGQHASNRPKRGSGS